MPFLKRFRKKRNNNGNGNQSRNQKPDSNEEFFESQAAEFVPNMGVELDKEIVEKKRDNVNEPKTPDSNEGFFESQAAKFVSKMGMELDKEIVEVTLNMEEFPGGERQIMQDANKNRVVTKEGIRVNRVDFGTYFHGFGLRKNDVIFLLNGHPIISEASVNMNLLRIINSSFNSKLYMKLFRAGAMSSVVNTERPEPSVLNLIAESSMVNAESSVVNTERPEPSVLNLIAESSMVNAESSVVNTERPEPSVLNLIAESSMVNAESSVVNTERPEPSVLNLIAESSMVNAESSVVNAERSTVDETVILDNKGMQFWRVFGSPTD
ncbi:uncharacterized protein LOC114528294 [Dendronephthya gigantea]|uniref:uncharacterized protein LOC114528294 n=1 Tax=Dendronephthya gigantea TaxID=151771 RepID=UPI00106A6A41|nr:uncharacterized protein LOC114528294 [Dendronephthya gigantea]